MRLLSAQLPLTLCLVLAAGCTGQTASESVSPSTVSKPSKSRALHRLFQLGAAHEQRGDHLGAVALWRQTFLMLPTGSEGDRLRQEILLRMTDALLAAHEADGRREHLVWGDQMLERYVAKHEALFGDEAQAVAKREELYARLGEFKVRLDVESGDAALAGEDRRIGAPSDGPETETIDEGFDALESHEHERSMAVDTHRGELVGAEGIHRNMTVRSRGRLATLDDPAVQRYLRHPSPMGQSLFVGDGLYHPARVLVRKGPSRVATDALDQGDRGSARKQVFALVRQARSDLEVCYAEALTRAPDVVSRVEFDLTVDEHGKLLAMDITEGRVVDAVGNACATWAMMRAEVEPLQMEEQLAQRVEVRVPMTFFLEGAKGPSRSWLGGGATPGDAIGEYDADRIKLHDAGAEVQRRSN
jgi:hypothetical protein